MKFNDVVFTGFRVVPFAVVTSGIRTLDSVVCSKVVFINHNNPTYRLYNSNTTGDYLSWVPVSSGNYNGVAVEGINNLSRCSVQRNIPSESAFTGTALIFIGE